MKAFDNLKHSMKVPYKLLGGHHEDPVESGGGCINDLVSIYSGHAQYTNGAWVGVTDSPPCVSPVIRAYTVAMNDQLPDADRQRLLAYLPKISGSVSPEHEKVRAEALVLYTIQHILPIALSAIGLESHALECESASDLTAGARAARTAAARTADAAARTADAAPRINDHMFLALDLMLSIGPERDVDPDLDVAQLMKELVVA